MNKLPQEVRDLLLAVVVGVVLSMLAVKIVGCTGRSGHVASALDAIAVAVDPAYSLAVDVCAAQEHAVVAARRAGLSEADADKAIRAVRPRCDQARQIFDAIREAHHGAVRALERGEESEAERLLERVRALWRELGKGEA